MSCAGAARRGRRTEGAHLLIAPVPVDVADRAAASHRTGIGAARMHPWESIRKWQAAVLKERSAAREHFLDLCGLLGERTPAEADPEGVWVRLRARRAGETGGGDGWADVWKRGRFGWEYKGKRANLDDAFAQLQRYAIALQRPEFILG